MLWRERTKIKDGLWLRFFVFVLAQRGGLTIYYLPSLLVCVDAAGAAIRDSAYIGSDMVILIIKVPHAQD